MNMGRTFKSLMFLVSEQQAHQQHTHGQIDMEMEQAGDG